MSDLISRQAAIDRIESHIRTGDELYSLTGTDKTLNYAFEVAASCVYNLPSAQPEIIRCKDCKHWREGTAFSYCDKLYGMGVLDALDYMVAEDDYCSMAERRTDEEKNI